MKTRVIVYTFVKSACILYCVGFVQAEWALDKLDVHALERVVLECLNNNTLKSCLVEKAGKAVERAINWDIPIAEGILFKKNNEKLNVTSHSRSHNEFNKLTNLLVQFMDSHTLTFNLGSMRELNSDDSELKDGGGKKKMSKRERKYFHYALLVLLGIFGLTAPVILKTLALIAGKALIASKIALIMLGSVALKKIFQADKDSGVKVHTHTIPIHEDDHDRYMDSSAYNFIKGP